LTKLTLLQDCLADVAATTVIGDFVDYLCCGSYVGQHHWFPALFTKRAFTRSHGVVCERRVKGGSAIASLSHRCLAQALSVIFERITLDHKAPLSKDTTEEQSRLQQVASMTPRRHFINPAALSALLMTSATLRDGGITNSEGVASVSSSAWPGNSCSVI